MSLDIGHALSNLWNATVGTAIRAVQEMFEPPERPEARPTMAQDESILRHSQDWELRATLDPTSPIVSNSSGTLISNSGGTLISNSGGTLISNSGGTLVSNSGGTFQGGDSDTLRTVDGGVLILSPDGKTESTGISIHHPDGSRTSIDQGVVYRDGNGNTTIGDSAILGADGKTEVLHPRDMPSTTPSPRP